MKTAVFLVKSITQKWRPPFGKGLFEMELVVEEGQRFDDFPKVGSVFKLIKCDGDKALIEFSEKFTLKGHLHPRDRQVWIGKEKAVSFTYLWGSDGITKSLRLREIVE